MFAEERSRERCYDCGKRCTGTRLMLYGPQRSHWREAADPKSEP